MREWANQWVNEPMGQCVNPLPSRPVAHSLIHSLISPFTHCLIAPFPPCLIARNE